MILAMQLLQRLQVLGERKVTCHLQGGQPVAFMFKVLPVTRPILSVAELEDHGCQVVFNRQPHMTYAEHGETRYVSLLRVGRLYFLPVALPRSPVEPALEPASATMMTMNPVVPPSPSSQPTPASSEASSDSDASPSQVTGDTATVTARPGGTDHRWHVFEYNCNDRSSHLTA